MSEPARRAKVPEKRQGGGVTITLRTLLMVGVVILAVLVLGIAVLRDPASRAAVLDPRSSPSATTAAPSPPVEAPPSASAPATAPVPEATIQSEAAAAAPAETGSEEDAETAKLRAALAQIDPVLLAEMVKPLSDLTTEDRVLYRGELWYWQRWANDSWTSSRITRTKSDGAEGADPQVVRTHVLTPVERR